MEQIFGLILAVVFGAIFGSYATLFAYRLPLGESCFGRYFGPKSRCPQCGTIIKTRDLIPLLNWLFTLGRCRSCKTKITRTHLFIELATTASFVFCYLKFSFGEEFIIHAILAVSLVVLLAVDYTHKHFPNSVLNVVAAIGLANRALVDQTIIDAIFSAAFGVVAAVVFYQILHKKNGGIFVSQNQSFDYTKFILAASVCLPLTQFLLFFLAVMLSFTILLLSGVFSAKSRSSFGYVLIIPFFYLLLSPALF